MIQSDIDRSRMLDMQSRVKDDNSRDVEFGLEDECLPNWKAKNWSPSSFSPAKTESYQESGSRAQHKNGYEPIGDGLGIAAAIAGVTSNIFGSPLSGVENRSEYTSLPVSEEINEEELEI